MKDKIGGKEMKEVSNTNKYRRVNLYETRKVKITLQSVNLIGH